VGGECLDEDAGLADGDFAERMMDADVEGLVFGGGDLCELVESGEGHGLVGLVVECEEVAELGVRFGAGSAEEDGFSACFGDVGWWEVLRGLVDELDVD